MPAEGGDQRKVIGLSLMEAMAALVPDADHGAIGPDLQGRVHSPCAGAGRVEEPLFDGIVELLDALEADGWLLGVATGKSDRGLRHCLKAMASSGRFVTLQTADRNPSKPHPAMALGGDGRGRADPDRTIFVGDTGWDMGCARAGVRARSARAGAITRLTN